MRISSTDSRGSGEAFGGAACGESIGQPLTLISGVARGPARIMEGCPSGRDRGLGSPAIDELLRNRLGRHLIREGARMWIQSIGPPSVGSGHVDQVLPEVDACDAFRGAYPLETIHQVGEREISRRFRRGDMGKGDDADADTGVACGGDEVPDRGLRGDHVG